MNACPSLPVEGPEGLAQALRAVDCLSRQATAVSFDRLFGSHGALAEVLTGLLALYVALLGLGLLSGRGSLHLSLLTPRALAVGLVLTFATSWVAYQQVVVNLALGAPDELARVLIGGHGSAVDRYAQRLDGIFAAVDEAAGAAAAAAGGDGAAKAPAVTPAAVLWLAAFLLLLGTAGLHIVAKLMLAALLALGPVFIVLALFRATRGLFEGWLRTLLLFALLPLLGVLVGGAALVLLAPLAQAVAVAGAGVGLRLAASLLLLACVHLVLMLIAIKAAAMLAGGWQWRRGTPGSATGAAAATPGPAPLAPLLHAGPPAAAGAALPWRPAGGGDERIRQLVVAGQRGFAAAAPAAGRAMGGAAGWPAAGVAPATASARRRTQGLVPARRPAPSSSKSAAKGTSR